MKVGRKIIVVCAFTVHARNVCIVLSRMPLKPNSITLAGSELVLEAGSKMVRTR